ncbi:MAG: histone deacetylase family protein [Pseudomonadota bacterium]
MKVVFSQAHALHRPRSFIKAGQVAPTPEIAERATRIAAVLGESGFEFVAPREHGLAPILAVHDAGLVDFLSASYEAWKQLPGSSDEIVPNVHPGPRFRSRPTGIVGRVGYYTQDTACPIVAGTWEAVRAAAGCAAEAARLVCDGAGAAYALCRPPGHHATADRAGGFCYLNNAAIAAQALRAQCMRVAIVDIDVHHGNGTQEIFYDRGDVLFASIHGDPSGFYPFYSGNVDERGAGEGRGANLNVPFPVGSGDTEVLAAFANVMACVREFSAQAVVISLGFDAHEKDPHGAHKVTTAGFVQMAESLGKLGLPTVLVQEGGYLHDELGSLARDFLVAFEGRA